MVIDPIYVGSCYVYVTYRYTGKCCIGTYTCCNAIAIFCIIFKVNSVCIIPSAKNIHCKMSITMTIIKHKRKFIYRPYYVYSITRSSRGVIKKY